MAAETNMIMIIQNNIDTNDQDCLRILLRKKNKRGQGATI